MMTTLQLIKACQLLERALEPRTEEESKALDIEADQLIEEVKNNG